ncbi:MAG: helix-turn-helix domain-containing protein, partial [Angustibacter sp.]
MNERTERRLALSLTQTDAARQAGVSLATWRRWEEDPESVRAQTRSTCERLLERESDFSKALAGSAAAFERAWSDESLSPRQAYAIACVLDSWADLHLQAWLRDPRVEPLHEISPFASFDLRVMMLVGENRAWVEGVRERCSAIANEIELGVLPFDRDGPFIDEVMVGAAMGEAADLLNDMPELFDRIAPRVSSESDDEYLPGDEDWDVVGDAFDDACRWDDWEVPRMKNHPLLPGILANRHPFTWFDNVPPTGPGYLQLLSGL